MERSRRQILKSGAAAGSLYLAGAGSVAASSESELAKPNQPDEIMSEVIKEANGKLELGAGRRYWPFEFSHSGSNIRIEYKVRTEGDAEPPDVLVLKKGQFSNYKVQAQSYALKTGPIFDTVTYDPGSFKWESEAVDRSFKIDLPSTPPIPTGLNLENIHPSRFGRRLQSEAGWNESLIDVYAVLNSGLIHSYHGVKGRSRGNRFYPWKSISSTSLSSVGT